MITKDSIENLKTHLDIVDIVSQFIELKKSGANFKACCPFHQEETPSMVVSPAKQIFHCFGCGVGGDSIKFVMDYEKLSYPETLEKLASMVNFSLQYDNNHQKKQDIQVIEKVNQYYQKLFIGNVVVQEYIKSRGISSSSIEKFEIGYAPKSYDTINFLKSNFLNLGDAKELGVIDTGQNGLYARFIERITFPIYALNAKIVGFGGRTISGHNAKYVNSPQTKVFNKSRLLYGYHIAKESIYKRQRIIVTEGYLDVIMLHQAGFDTAVATLGTALTAEHLPLLKRGEPKVIVAYDGDKPGLNAALKAAVMLSHSNFEGGVVIFAGGMDPADMVKDGKIKELENMFAQPKPFIPFVIDMIITRYDIHIPEQKQHCLKEVNEYLKTLTPILQDEYARYVASALNINTKHVHVQQQSRAKNVQTVLTHVDIAELSIIKTVLDQPNMIDMVLDIVDESMFLNHQEEFKLLLSDKENPKLRGILLQEELILYTQEELKQQLLRFLINFYNQKLYSASMDKTLNLKRASLLIRKIKENIRDLKAGKLVSYNLI
ncbi:MAG: DNA primase [Campylobacterota bacterium]|nr:DNA primase [Campylobacterota bacterium]